MKRGVVLISLLAVIFCTAGGVLFWWVFKQPPDNPGIEQLAKKQVFLRPLFANKESYDEIFYSLPQISEKPKIEAGIVSHHFLAKELIAKFYHTVSDNEVSTVFLVSPDHFNNFFESGTVAFTSKLPWQTPFGILYSDAEIADNLIKSGGVLPNDPVAGLEHGISVETPFVKYFFPRAAIVPVIVKNTSDYAEFFKLGQRIKKARGKGSILIVSSDFSHGLPAAEAKIKDGESIRILDDLSIDKINSVNNDCRPCLAVLAGFIGKSGRNFSLVDNKNSFDFSKGNKEAVTSYVSGYYTIK